MRTSLRICIVVGSMSMLLVAGSGLHAQSLAPVVMPVQAPTSLSGYGVPVGVAPVAINAYGQPVPVYGQLAAAPLTNTAGITRLSDGQTKPAFRVTVVADEAQQAPKPEAPKQETEQEDAVLFPDDGKDSSCKSGDCQKSCGHAGDCCCFQYAFRVYGEYLYLRARDSEVCYAVQGYSNTPPQYQAIAGLSPVQTSPISVLDQDFSSGFRAGLGICLDECSEIGASFTWFDTSTENSITRDGDKDGQIIPMVLHPGTVSTDTGTVQAAGRHDIEFNLIDVDYRSFLVQGCTSHLDYVLGLRYGNLEQTFAARYSDNLNDPDNNAYEAATDIDFDGAGLRLGLEGERYYSRVPVKLYMKGFASVLAGEFDATYQQTVQQGAYNGVDTGWKAGRIVPTFDLELGGGIYLPGGKMQATVGYVFSAWTNVVKTEDWIQAVQANDFRDMGDTITFDGIVARVEGRF